MEGNTIKQKIENIIHIVGCFVLVIIFTMQLIFMNTKNNVDLLDYTVLFICLIGFLNALVRLIISKKNKKI